MAPLCRVKFRCDLSFLNFAVHWRKGVPTSFREPFRSFNDRILMRGEVKDLFIGVVIGFIIKRIVVEKAHKFGASNLRTFYTAKRAVLSPRQCI